MEKEVVGFDIETSGLDWENDRIASVQLYFPRTDTPVFIPIEMKDMPQQYSEDEKRALLQKIADRVRVVGYNLSGDMLFFRKYGVKLEPAFDGFIYLSMTPRALQFGKDDRTLKGLCEDMGLGVNLPRFEEVCPGKDFTQASVNDKRAVEYAINDAKLSWELGKALVRSYPVNKDAHNIEMKVLPQFVEMTYEGMNVDPDKISKLSATLQLELHELNQKIFKEAGFEVRANSAKDLQKLFEEKKWPLPPVKGSSGRPSFSEDSLEPYSTIPLVQLILEARGLIYAIPRLDKILLDHIHNNKLHPEYLQVGWTGGARVYTKSPSTNSLSMAARDAVIPRPGYKFVYFDWSGAELMLAAQWAGEQELIDVYNNGGDPIRYVASKLLGVPPESITDDQREVTKVVIYGILYGSEGIAIARALKISEPAARSLVELFWERMTRIASLRDELNDIAYQNGYTRTITGFVRHLPNTNAKSDRLLAEAKRKTFNSAIQGSVACLFKLAMIDAPSLFEEVGRVVTGVFDSFLLEIKEEVSVESLIPEFNTLSTFCFGGDLQVKFRYKIGVGHSWKEAQESVRVID